MGKRKRKLQIETVAGSRLKLAPYNPRTISQRQRDALRHQIERFGDVQPKVVNRKTMHIVGGNQRFIIETEDLGWTEFAVVFVSQSQARENEKNN